MPLDDIVVDYPNACSFEFSRGNTGSVTEIVDSDATIFLPAVTGGGLTSYGFGSA